MKGITRNGARLSLPAEIPHASLIASGMKAAGRQQAAKTKRGKPEKKRLTGMKNGKPALLAENSLQAAVEKLFLYEESGATPYEIHILQERVKRLEERVKRLESYD